MSGLNVEGIVRNAPYIMGDGDLIEIMTVGLTSVEKCGEREVVAVRIMSPKITKTHQEHAVFEDMMPMEDVCEPLHEEDSVN